MVLIVFLIINTLIKHLQINLLHTVCTKPMCQRLPFDLSSVIDNISIIHCRNINKIQTVPEVSFHIKT